MKAQFSHDTLPDCEKMVECPYNKAHLVVQHRMANHIIKCRRNQETYGVKDCRFNSSHVVPISEIKSHEATCPDRVIIEDFVNHRIDQAQPSSKSSTTSGYNTVKCESDWDNMSVPSYKPTQRR